MGLSVECLEMNVDFVTLVLGLILKTPKMIATDSSFKLVLSDLWIPFEKNCTVKPIGSEFCFTIISINITLQDIRKSVIKILIRVGLVNVFWADTLKHKTQHELKVTI